jgi:hypothetical protein
MAMRWLQFVFGITAAAVLASIVVAALIDDRTLTPLVFLGEPQFVPGIHWTVVGGQLLVLALLVLPPSRHLGIPVAAAFALANLAALSLNGLGSLMFFRYEGQTDWQALRLILFMTLQAILLVASSILWFGDNRSGRLRRIGIGVGVATAWAAGQWLWVVMLGQ